MRSLGFTGDSFPRIGGFGSSRRIREPSSRIAGGRGRHEIPRPGHGWQRVRGSSRPYSRFLRRDSLRSSIIARASRPQITSDSDNRGHRESDSRLLEQLVEELLAAVHEGLHGRGEVLGVEGTDRGEILAEGQERACGNRGIRGRRCGRPAAESYPFSRGRTKNAVWRANLCLHSLASSRKTGATDGADGHISDHRPHPLATRTESSTISSLGPCGRVAQIHLDLFCVLSLNSRARVPSRWPPTRPQRCMVISTCVW